eukprot:m.131736 g.131736  ORF g.131736 m.131736 type:complete len:284 (-) comp9818_c0_seq6:189-1040(-)
MDVALLVLTWATCGALLGGWRHLAPILGVTVLLKWLGLLYFLQAFSSTGALVRMVLQIAADMRSFLAILGIAVLGLSSAFYALLSHQTLDTGDENPFRGPGHALFYMFNMLLLGAFDTSTFVFGDYEELAQVLFVGGMVFTLIILLNLLIALMSDSYERIQDRAEIEFLMLRSRILVEQERFCSPEELAKHAPQFLHVLVPEGSGDMEGLGGTSEQWNGVLHALKQQIREVKEQNERLESKLEHQNAESKEHMEDMKHRLEQQNAELKLQLEQVIVLLQQSRS